MLIRFLNTGFWRSIAEFDLWVLEDSAKQMMYEYDYHQFRESADKINEETVRASPAKYMSYVPEVEKSLEEQFEELKASNEMLTGCVLEMSELVYQ